MVELQSVDHHHHDLSEREQFFFDVSLKQYSHYVFLQTCNRVEIYHGDGLTSPATANHLFRVVSGLESAIVGENNIQGQVKEAYQNAIAKETISKGLHKLFQLALFVGKRVRTETEISRGVLSHSHAVTKLLWEKSNRTLENKNIVLIGAHHLNEKVIQYLTKYGAKTIFLGNRTYEKAQELVAKYEGKAFPLNKLSETLKSADVVITATKAPHFILDTPLIPEHKEIMIFDLAVPRDVHPHVGDLPNVTLFNISEIEAIITNNVNNRQKEILKAEKIIKEEVDALF